MNKLGYFSRFIIVVLIILGISYSIYAFDNPDDESNTVENIFSNSHNVIYSPPVNKSFQFCVKGDNDYKLIISNLSQKLSTEVIAYTNNGKELDKSDLDININSKKELVLDSNSSLITLDAKGSDFIAYLVDRNGNRSECQDTTFESMVFPGFSTQKGIQNNLIISNPYDFSSSVNVSIVGTSSQSTSEFVSLEKTLKNISIEPHASVQVDFNQSIRRSDFVFVNIFVKTGNITAKASRVENDKEVILPYVVSTKDDSNLFGEKNSSFALYNPNNIVTNISVQGSQYVVSPNSAIVINSDLSGIINAKAEGTFYFASKSLNSGSTNFTSESRKFKIITNSVVKILNRNNSQVQCNIVNGSETTTISVNKNKVENYFKGDTESIINIECDLPVKIYSFNSVYKLVTDR